MNERIERARATFEQCESARMALWAEFEALARSKDLRGKPERVDMLRDCLVQYRMAAWDAQAAMTAFLLAIEEERRAS